ncbi:MAG: hypothetical protein ABSH41_17670, partial [Syntrophobacteraceae bacterium]
KMECNDFIVRSDSQFAGLNDKIVIHVTNIRQIRPLLHTRQRDYKIKRKCLIFYHTINRELLF